MDDSDAGRHGELRDGAARSPGMIGTAVSIDGDGAHVHLPQSDLFDGFAAVTVAAWIRAEPGGTGDWSTIIEKASGGKPKHPHVLWIGFRRESRTWAFQIATDRGQNFFQSFRVKVQHGAWTHVAVTIDVATRRAQLFIDGELRRDLAQLKLRGSTLWSNPKGATAIGMIAQGANNFWNGALDEVRIYRGTLPPDTIRVLARAPGKAGASEPEPAPRPN